MLLQRTAATKAVRRLAAAISAVTLGVGLLSGCGSDSVDRPSGDTTAAAAGGAFPVTVEHAFGSTQIPEAPERVVALGYTDDQAILRSA